MYKLRDMQKQDLSMVRHWRNAAQIKKYLFSQNEISATEHEQWFYDKQAMPDHYLKVFEHNKLAIGFLQLFCKKHKSYEWGFYVAPTHLAQGHGKALIKKALEFAFTTLDADKVSGKVLQGNIASEKLHRSNGFRQEAVLSNEIALDKVKNILCFSLLKNEWLHQQ